MTAQRFYDWQTAGGTDDVMRPVNFLAAKVKARSTSDRRQSKRIKDLGDISRLVESHPRLSERLPPPLQAINDRPGS
jgi:hypothetical protein